MPRTKKLTEEEKKQIALLQNQQKMLDENMTEVSEKGDKLGVMKLLQKAKEENEVKFKAVSSDITSEDIKELLKKEDKGVNMESEPLNKVIERLQRQKNVEENIEQEKYIDEEIDFETEAPKMENVDTSINSMPDTDLQYDIIPLPSNGECYPSKIKKVAVKFLTAESENLITSPNLYKDDMIIDTLLKYHLLSKEINPEDLVQGDIDAIMLWLRATGYGNDYPVRVKDPQTSEEFDSIVDLSKLNIKPFTIKGDENGHFTYELPKMKAKIKFKFLSRQEERDLNMINKFEANDVRYSMIKDSYNVLKEALKYEKSMSSADRIKIDQSINGLKVWANKRGEDTKILHVITNRLEMMVTSINGETNKEFIHNFIMHMPAIDCYKFRRYIEENTPGIDWNTSVERPGGGTFSMFLEWSKDAFFNIA